MTRLSVNINKIATLRNARGGNIPDVLKAAKDCEEFGADGITVHPRPDERHIRYSDVRSIKSEISSEFNIEGYPSESFLKLIEEVSPAQVTLVPDGPDALTSNAGWDTKSNKSLLMSVISKIKSMGIRASLFVDPKADMINHAAKAGADRVELYTEAYATDYFKNKELAVKKYLEAAEVAKECNLGLNAGHDLNLDNLEYFNKTIPWLDEVSIGHALIADALYLGLENTIQMYQRKLIK